MSKLTKNQKLALGKIEAGKAYTLKEASALVKEITTTKFDASVDVDVRLGVDPRKANQMVRGVVSLPHGTGKQVRVLALCTPDKEAEATAAGADYVGLDEYIEKIKGGWTDIDVIITMPSIMGKIGALGRVLGPRGLMPNPKSGTVTNEIGNAVKEVKQGKIDFKVDKSGIVHTHFAFRLLLYSRKVLGSVVLLLCRTLLHQRTLVVVIITLEIIIVVSICIVIAGVVIVVVARADNALALLWL